MRSIWVAGVVLACLWAAAASAQPVRRDSIIDLVYLGGPDCPYCRAWEAKELPRLRAMEEFKHIRFTHVLKKIPEPVPPPLTLPEHLKPMYDQMIRVTKKRAARRNSCCWSTASRCAAASARTRITTSCRL